jgi:hypothetical protein
MPAHSAVSMVRTRETGQRFRKGEVFLAGAVGALAPQILRWYTQWDGHGGMPDPLIAAGRAAVTLAFVALAGYVAMVWDVRNLKEGFLVGVGVPAVILGSGSDLASLAKVPAASAQTLRVAAPARDHGIARLIVHAVGEDGRQIPGVLLIATADTDQSRVSGPNPLVLRPGHYSLVIQARGYETEDRVIRLSPEETLQLTVHLRPLSAANRFIRGVREPFQQRSQ